MTQQSIQSPATEPPSREVLIPWRIALGLVVATVTFLVCRNAIELAFPAAVTAAVTALCAAWWCTEAVPIPVTSLVPFAVFPFFGILDHADLASAYGDKFILLFMAGFMLSRAAEKSGAHFRVAHTVIRLVGQDSPRRLVVAFMLATAFCSMWINNTATALIMLPAAIAVLNKREGDDRFAVSLLLAIAYGASVGGMATLIGTAPNALCVSIYSEKAAKIVSFADWLVVGLPVVVLMLVAVGLVLALRLPAANRTNRQNTEPVLGNLGPWTPAQRRTLIVIGLTALAWITRTSPGGGWSGLLNLPDVHDATVALVAVVACFLLPSGEHSTADNGSKTLALLDWKTARNIPWGILILFGGGIALGRAFDKSGLADAIGGWLSVLNDLPLVAIVGVICLTVTFLTEITSNTATTALLMPILAAAAQGAGVDPAMLMIPAALSASCAFMLPVATPPNAIVFGADRLTIPQMARVGFILNLIGAVIITSVCYVVVDRDSGIGTAATEESKGSAMQVSPPG